jgi:cytochrome c-type biogenesis protein CcmF
MPWLLGLILLHSYHKEKYLDLDQSLYTIFFSLVVFFSSLVSLFFVRSGFLNSVHAFVNDYTSGVFFLVLLFIFMGYISFRYYHYQKKLTSVIYSHHICSERGLLFFSINIILLFFVILSFGTFYPIIYNIFTNQDLSLSLLFYNDSLKVLILPFLYLFIIKHLNKYNYIFFS